ncbi:unnamed protein product [Merluccius merluccius]
MFGPATGQRRFGSSIPIPTTPGTEDQRPGKGLNQPHQGPGSMELWYRKGKPLLLVGSGGQGERTREVNEGKRRFRPPEGLRAHLTGVLPSVASL